MNPVTSGSASPKKKKKKMWREEHIATWLGRLLSLDSFLPIIFYKLTNRFMPGLSLLTCLVIWSNLLPVASSTPPQTGHLVKA